jgi:hypothetical protein
VELAAAVTLTTLLPEMLDQSTPVVVVVPVLETEALVAQVSSL